MLIERWNSLWCRLSKSWSRCLETDERTSGWFEKLGFKVMWWQGKALFFCRISRAIQIQSSALYLEQTPLLVLPGWTLKGSQDSLWKDSSQNCGNQCFATTTPYSSIIGKSPTSDHEHRVLELLLGGKHNMIELDTFRVGEPCLRMHNNMITLTCPIPMQPWTFPSLGKQTGNHKQTKIAFAGPVAVSWSSMIAAKACILSLPSLTWVLRKMDARILTWNWTIRNISGPVSYKDSHSCNALDVLLDEHIKEELQRMGTQQITHGFSSLETSLHFGKCLQMSFTSGPSKDR